MLTNWACWGGVVFSAFLLATRIMSAGGLRICDCSGAVLVGATLMAFMAPMAGIGYFVIQLFGQRKPGKGQGFARFCTFCGLPVAVVGLNSMVVSGLVCPLCVGVWACFTMIAFATLRSGVRLAPPSSAMRSLGTAAVLLIVGIVIAQNPPPPPRNANCTDENCCRVGCVRSSGGWVSYLTNGYDKYKRPDGPGVVSKPCKLLVFDKPNCTGTRLYEYSEQRQCCDWRIVPGER